MELRNHSRTAVSAPVKGRVPATPVEIKLVNLSLAGCMVESRSPVPPGTTILIELAPGEEVAGEVVWGKGTRHGVKFHTALASDALARFTYPLETGNRSFGVMRDRFGRELPCLRRMTIR